MLVIEAAANEFYVAGSGLYVSFLRDPAYEVLGSLGDMILSAQASDKIRGVVLRESSPRPTKTVALGGYLFEATLARSPPASAPYSGAAPRAWAESHRPGRLSPQKNFQARPPRIR